jgi:hypothetical protein
MTWVLICRLLVAMSFRDPQVRLGNGFGSCKRLMERLVDWRSAWLVVAWHRGHTQSRITYSHRIISGSASRSMSCIISRSPFKSGETEICYLIFRLGNDPQDTGTRPRRWLQEKKAGWYTVLADPQMPVTSTLLDQAHNTIERKLFAMKGFHHPKGSQQAFLTGLAHLYNLVPYQRRAQHAGQCGVEVEGGTVPTRDWCLNLQILTSGGFR